MANAEDAGIGQRVEATAMMNTITELELPISETLQQRAWAQSQAYSTPRNRWQAYLNQVCLETFLPWLQAEYAPDASMTLQAGDLVNGGAIAWGEKRLVLIPQKHFDARELRVPQEWIDVPSWAGDYYLAVQVDPDDALIRVWGYATHEQIKTVGQQDASDRTYTIDAQFLVQDMTVLWVVRQLYADEPTRAVITELTTVPETQAENLLQRLSNAEEPRLEIPFMLWGSLLETSSWMTRLVRSRQGENATTNLRQWFTNAFTNRWQALEEWLNPEELAFSFRQIESTESTTIRRVKALELLDQTILLMIAISPENDDRVSIRVQVRPADRSICLPMNLSLSLISVSSEVVQSVQAREQDNSIQLQRFRCSIGTEFSLRVALEETEVTEAFQV